MLKPNSCITEIYETLKGPRIQYCQHDNGQWYKRVTVRPDFKCNAFKPWEKIEGEPDFEAIKNLKRKAVLRNPK